MFRSELWYCREVISVAKQKFNLQGRKVTENKLNPLITDLKCPVNVKANFNFAIHQSKTFVMILVNKFDVSSLMLVKNQWCWVMLIVCSILLNWRLSRTWLKHYVTIKFPCQTFTILLRVPTKNFVLYQKQENSQCFLLFSVVSRTVYGI